MLEIIRTTSFIPFCQRSGLTESGLTEVDVLLKFYSFCSPYCWTKLQKTCCGTLTKSLKWLDRCIQNKRKSLNLTLYNASQIVNKSSAVYISEQSVALHKICVICCYNGLNEIV